MNKHYIYIDESGDLGLSSNSSNVIIISAIITDNPAQFDRIIKNARRNKFKKELRKAKEIKFNKSSLELKEYLISKLNETTGCYGVHCILDKSKLYSPYLKQKKDKLYNYIAGDLASLINLNSNNVEVRIDKSKGKYILRKDFNEYFKFKLKNGSKVGVVEIYHSNSENFSGIQMADVVAGAAYQKYNNNNANYIDIINLSKFPQTFHKMWEK
ncbi:DUF3800 domain-containing protein [Ferroplasma sp.]|uniref:DUF3800 domain-containing protein n=1 Tax=Ferroplasma sp. TaxID=2591003 RepID=UPI00307F8327